MNKQLSEQLGYMFGCTVTIALYLGSVWVIFPLLCDLGWPSGLALAVALLASGLTTGTILYVAALLLGSLLALLFPAPPNDQNQDPV